MFCLSKSRRFRSLALLVGCLVTAASAAQTATPPGVLAEAESPPPQSTHRVIQDATASGGAAVTTDKAWEPIFRAKTPDSAGQVTVHVRHRGGPLLLKRVRGGEQSDLKQIWAKPADWTWTAVGPITAADLGDELVIIRGGDGAAGPPTVDAVVFAGEGKPTAGGPQTAGDAGVAAAEAASEGGDTGSAPDLTAPAVPVPLTLDWSSPGQPITALHWGVADYAILHEGDTRIAGFSSYVRSVNPAIIRIHHANMANLWTDPATRSWDAPKIQRAFEDAASAYGDARIMLNIPSWPTWLHDGPTLPPDKEEEFARLVADLVRVMRDDVGVPVAWWEPLNEKDNNYEREGRLDDLWALYNRLAVAIKTVDPEAKVGGPAFTWPKPEWVNGFLEHCGEHVDFVTWHNYATGDANASNTSIFAKVSENLGPNAQTVVDALARHLPKRHIPTFLDEYNISWTWRTREPRMGTNIGAIFDALVVKEMAERGVSGATVWHVMDNIYGLIQKDGTLRTPAYLFQWGRPYLTGALLPTRSAAPESLEAMTVQLADGHRSVLLIVKSRTAVQVPGGLTALGLSGENVRAMRIDHDGHHPDVAIPAEGALSLPGYSLTLLTTRPANVH